MSKTIITGIRANNELHIGNYLGAIKKMADTQKSLDKDDTLYMFVPDLHSFTTEVDHTKLYEQTISNLKWFIAGGIDASNEQTVLFRQSQVPAHSELAWILSNFTYFGEASRMTEFKDKSEKLGNKSVSVGLFGYPILMAADILLYHANYVPLGDDQKQHMELARLLAERVNKKFDSDIFTVPEPWEKQLEFTASEQSLRVMSLKDPSSKMSKSVSDPKGTIDLNDSPEEASKKIMEATTDSIGSVNFDTKNQKGICNLLTLASLLGGENMESVVAKWQGQTQYGELKTHVAQLVSDFLRDIQAKRDSISDDKVNEILVPGEVRANEIANHTLLQVQRAVGLKK